jgi:hypothetical protein
MNWEPFDSEDRCTEFWVRMEAVLADYPELSTVRDEADRTELALEGIDPDAPKMVTAMCFLATFDDGTDRNGRLWLTSPDVSHYHALGMAVDFESTLRFAP